MTMPNNQPPAVNCRRRTSDPEMETIYEDRGSVVRRILNRSRMKRFSVNGRSGGGRRLMDGRSYPPARSVNYACKWAKPFAARKMQNLFKKSAARRGTPSNCYQNLRHVFSICPSTRNGDGPVVLQRAAASSLPEECQIFTLWPANVCRCLQQEIPI